MTRRSYSGNAKATTLNAGIDATATTINLVSGTGYPAGGAAGPFYIVIDRGLAAEEKILCDSTAVNTITVNVSGRGADGTTPAVHALGAIVEHCWTATDADEANAHINDVTIDVHPQYTTTAELATHSSAADPHTAYLTSAEVAAAIAAATSAVVPIGGITPYAGSAAPTNWLLCDGATVSQATYATLYSIVGHTYGADPGGGNFILPNLKGKVPVGINSAEAEFDTRGETGGAKTVALTTAELASHNHTQDAHDHTQDAHDHPQDSHAHTFTTSTNGLHAHSIDGDYGNRLFVTAAGNKLSSSGDGQQGSFSDIDDDGSHAHTGTSDGFTANNQTTTANNQTTIATNQATGSGTAHNNLQPYVALHYIIRAL